MIKKQVNLRLNPGTIEMIKEIQAHMLIQGFSMSQADVVEESIMQLYKNMDLRKNEGR